jgi:hypothetical protein
VAQFKRQFVVCYSVYSGLEQELHIVPELEVPDEQQSQLKRRIIQTNLWNQRSIDVLEGMS